MCGESKSAKTILFAGVPRPSKFLDGLHFLTRLKTYASFNMQLQQNI